MSQSEEGTKLHTNEQVVFPQYIRSRDDVFVYVDSEREAGVVKFLKRLDKRLNYFKVSIYHALHSIYSYLS